MPGATKAAHKEGHVEVMWSSDSVEQGHHRSMAPARRLNGRVSGLCVAQPVEAGEGVGLFALAAAAQVIGDHVHGGHVARL